MDHIFNNNTQIIADILNRILNCMHIKKLYVYGSTELLEGLYPRIHVVRIFNLGESPEGIFYIKCTDQEDLRNVIPWIREHRTTSDILLYVESEAGQDEEIVRELGEGYGLRFFSGMEGSIFLVGRAFDKANVIRCTPENFKVLAIVHTYNEGDVIEKLIYYLLEQEVDVYIVDNWSEDNTCDIVQRLQKEFPGRVFLERFPKKGKTEYYEWYQQLERTEELGKCLPYDWFIHYDADEMRISPWRNVSLKQAIYYIDSLGYNLIENTVIDFKLTKDDSENIFMKDVYFDFGHRNSHFKQTKSWKKTDSITLKETGGHIAVVPEPQIFPLKILTRHYPFRNMEQAVKKVFTDRKPRFMKERGERGWHGQYDVIKDKNDLLTDPVGLLKWDEKTFEQYYVPLFLGCGIAVEKRTNCKHTVPSELLHKKIVIYGAGNIGKAVYPVYAEACEVVAWVDKKYNLIPDIYCESIVDPENLIYMDFDYIVIAVEDSDIKEEIRKQLLDMEIDNEKIV